MPGRTKVLVVDDEIALRFPICEVLKDLGIEVLEADSADAALKLVVEDPEIGLIFSDVRMPGALDGIALCEAVERSHPDIITLLTSGYLPTGAVAPRRIISKPYNLDTVSRLILAHLNETRSH